MSDNVIKWQYIVDGTNFDSAGMASQGSKHRFKQLGLDDMLIRRIVIAMYEAEINMVIHANGGTAVVEVTPSQVVVTLADKGKGIADISQAMQAGFSTATEEVRNLGFGAGMGLPNMKKYSDDIQVTSVINEGTTVRLTYNLN